MKLFRKKTAVRTPLASARIPDVPFSALPKPIARTLRAAAARIRRIVALRGAMATLAAALIAILAIMAVDWMVTILNPWVRWGLWAVGIGAVALVAHASLVRPLSRRLTPARLAALIERNHPELEERLSTVVELMASPDSLAEGSELLMKVVTEAAVQDTGKLSMKREFTARTVRPRFLLAAGALAVLLLLFTVWSGPTARLFLRAIAPGAEVDNVYAENLRVAPGSAVVLRGRPFSIDLAVLGGFPGQAYVRISRPDGTGKESAERMTQDSADEDGVRRYRHTIAAVEGSFRYRIHCGSAVTHHYDVLALEPPDFTNAVATLSFPAYTATADRELPPDQRDIAAVAGTRVALRATPVRPLHAALLLPGETALPAEPGPDGDLHWTFALTNGMSGSWGIRVWDDNGFTNAPDAFPLSVVPDAAPVFAFDSPTNHSFELPPHGRIPLSYSIEEDFGFAGAPRLQASVRGGGWSTIASLPVEESMLEGVWTGEGEASLGLLSLDGGQPGQPQNVRFRVEVTDNFPAELGGPHVAYSPILSVRLDGDRRTLARQKLDGARNRADKTAADIQRALDAALNRARQARNEAAAQRDQTALDRLSESKEKILEAARTADRLLREAAQGPLDAVAPEVKELLAARIEPAQEAADAAAAADPEERVAALDELVSRLADALQGAQELRKDVEKAWDEMKKAEEVAEMADRQKALAEQAAKEMSPEERAAWEQKQDQLKRELEQRMKELAGQDPLAEQKKEAGQTAEKMEKLADLQKKLAELQERLRDAESRKSAEDELRDLTPKLPQDATAAERMEKLQEEVFDEARRLQEQIAAMQARLDALENEKGNPLDQAAQDALKAQQEAQQAMDAFQSNPEWDGERDPNAETKQADGDPNAQRDWDGERDPTMETKQADGDPNAQRNWDGQKDPNAQDEQKDGEWDPNAQRNWDGKKDPNAKDEAPKDGQWDPNRKKDPWDGKIDPNALMNKAAEDMQKAADALKEAQDQMQQMSDQMRQQQQQNAQQAQQAMDAAQQAMQQQGQQQQQQQQQQGQQQQQQQQGQEQSQSQQQGQSDAQSQAQKAADAMQKMAEQMKKEAGSQQQNQQQNEQQSQNESESQSQSESSSQSSSHHSSTKHDKPPKSQEGVPMLFRNLGLSDADWFKMNGDVGSERFDNALQGVPAEYRDLVKAYFQGLNELQ